MTDTDAWFEELWQTYPSDLAHKRKGRREAALRAVNKLKPNEDLRSKILVSLRELMRHYRNELKMTGRTDRWPYLSTWINQKGWTEVLEKSASELKAEDTRRCGCGNKAEWTGAGKVLCFECYDKTYGDPNRAARKAELERLGLVESGDDKAAVINRCRDYLRSKGMLGRVIESKRSPTATGSARGVR